MKSVLEIAKIPDNKIGNDKYDNGIHFKSFRNIHLHNVQPFRTPTLHPQKFHHMKLENELKPSYNFNRIHVEDASLKFRGIPRYTPKKNNENPLYNELGLKGTSAKDVFVSRMQEEAGTPTILGAKLEGRENETSPREEFWKLYNQMKSSSTTAPIEDADKIIIEPVVSTEEMKTEQLPKTIKIKKMAKNWRKMTSIFPTPEYFKE